MAYKKRGWHDWLFQQIEGEDNYYAPLVFVESTDDAPIIVENSNLPLSAFGEVLTAGIVPEASWRFDYGINTRFVSTSGTANGGFVSGSANRAQLGTTNNLTGSAYVTTIKSLRYIPGFGGLLRATAVFSSGVALSEQGIGIIDTNDGFAFGYNGATFGVMRRRAGVDTWIPQSQWNGDTLTETHNPHLGNIYQIRFQWLGYGNIYFFIFDKYRRKYVNVHTIEYPNTSEFTHILNPTLPIRAWVRNYGNSLPLNLYTPSALAALEGCGHVGYHNPLDVFNAADTTTTLADTDNNHILTVRNKTTFAGIANRVPIQIRNITLSRSSSGSATSTIRLYRNVATVAPLSYTDVDTANSPVDISTTATDVTSASAERAYSLSSSQPFASIDFQNGEFTLAPGQGVSIGWDNSGVQSTEVTVTITWQEQF